ncbi:MAG: lysylphosphatidylglycerol synthase transmembrane domain-containing protein [Alphaproteobacteria bacterium]
MAILRGQQGHRVLLAAKLAIPAIVVLWIFRQFDLAESLENLSQLSALIVAEVFLLLIFQQVLAAWRLAVSVTMSGASIGHRAAVATTFVGNFFSQAMLSFVGGDAMRTLELTRQGIPVIKAAVAIVLDRVSGMFALMAMVTLGLVSILDLITSQTTRLGLFALLAAGLAFAAAFVLLGFMPATWRRLKRLGPLMELVSAGRYAFSAPWGWTKALFGSFLINLLNVLIIFVLARGFGLDVSLLQCLIVVPPVLLMAMMPISIGGWGVREGAMVVGFSLYGQPGETVLLISIIFGLASLVVALPGGLIWLLYKRNTGKTDFN